MPITIYGSGGQTRGYLNLNDTLRCVGLTLENPAKSGELRIFNQFTEVFTVTEIADKVLDAANELGIRAEIQHIDNPRTEQEEHYYNPSNEGLIQLGLVPQLLDRGVLVEMMTKISNYKSNIQEDMVKPQVKWH